MNERIVQLREFALGIAGIKPDLSAALNSFLTLSETLFGNPDFKSVAIKEKLAADLLSSPEKEKPTSSTQRQRKNHRRNGHHSMGQCHVQTVDRQHLGLRFCGKRTSS